MGHRNFTMPHSVHISYQFVKQYKLHQILWFVFLQTVFGCLGLMIDEHRISPLTAWWQGTSPDFGAIMCPIWSLVCLADHSVWRMVISANCLITKPRFCPRLHSRYCCHTVLLLTHSSIQLLEGQTSSPVRDAVLTLEAALRKRGSAVFAVGHGQAQTAVRDGLGCPNRHTAVPGSASSLLNASWNSIWIISTPCSPFRHFFSILLSQHVFLWGILSWNRRMQNLESNFESICHQQAQVCVLISNHGVVRLFAQINFHKEVSLRSPFSSLRT